MAKSKQQKQPEHLTAHTHALVVLALIIVILILLCA